MSRYLPSVLSPTPIDTWALKLWNAKVRRAREEYHRSLETLEFYVTGSRRPCQRCPRRTTHDSGLCCRCRDKRDREPCKSQGCRVLTVHESRICSDCRRGKPVWAW